MGHVEDQVAGENLTEIAGVWLPEIMSLPNSLPWMESVDAKMVRAKEHLDTLESAHQLEHVRQQIENEKPESFIAERRFHWREAIRHPIECLRGWMNETQTG